ncbi:Acyl-CoA N-acyltransferase [Cordyceps fumosorosea ARSEF 2679]|uniref:Acyl-CoA N-acyltransferase n=1 Tax=Cordyceps fumosorosea (strain ARSEF 2679) TaxID=1081104 RepID=A0A168CN03_CORFA|nr:Acyl-CoA N-acyltransferase [Cordyceps fumosorosea ARSEF 2679]OAA71577.1 Acyl-CoA N-acyltransferase [Cordyceps fumosorosea ARSEF 2679]
MADTAYSQDAPPPPPDLNPPPPHLAICPPAPTLRPPPLESVTDGTVTIRRWLASDADALFHIITNSRARLAAWMPWARRDSPYQRHEAVAFTERTALRWDAGSGWDYAITTGEQVIGSCGLRRREDNPGVDAGYWLAEGHTGKGLATRAVGLLTEQAWGMGVPSVRVVHDEANGRSAGVPRRLGFECEGEVEAEDNPEGRRDTVWVKYRGAS